MRNRPLIHELAIAAGVGALFAASPLTGSHLGSSLLAGGAIAAAVFAIRSRKGIPGGEPGEQARPRGVSAPLSALLVVAGLWVLTFLPTLHWLWGQWTGSVWTNNHGVFMPALMGVLAWQSLRDDPGERPEGSALGFVWLAAALALALCDAALRTGYLGVLGMIISLPGLALLLLGPRRTRRLAVPLALGLLMVPLPAAVATSVGLRHATAAAVEPLLHALGVSALRRGTVIQLAGEGNTFVVADECSGLAALYAGFAVAIVLACYARRPWRRVALLASAAPLAIAANTLRVVALILMSSGIGHWIMETKIHPLTGVATFVVVVVGLLWVAGRDPFGDTA